MRLLSLIICLITLNATAQQLPDSGPLDSLLHLSQRYYNARQSDSLYYRPTTEFREQLPVDGWRTFLTNTYTTYGRWLRSEFTGKKGEFTTYKSRFERGTLLFQLASNQTGRIAGFRLSPYIEPRKLATSNPLRTRFDRQLDSIVQAHAAQHTVIALSIGVLRNDSLLVYSYGETSAGNNRLPDGNTQFEIGSISKTFTATLLAHAVGRGLIRLDDPVNNHLPDFIPALQKEGVPITIRMLANHTSGLPRLPANLLMTGYSMQNPYRTYDRKALFAFLKTVPISSRPGAAYQYSNLAVGLLGTILELKTGQPYEQQLLNVITRPLGMVHTQISLSDADKQAMAQGHTGQGQPTANWDFQALAGAGAIRSTVNDLLIYLQAQLGKGPEKLIKTMRLTHAITFKNDQRTVGLGWHHNSVGNDVWLMHNGGTGGFVSFAGFNFTNKTAIVVLSNTTTRIDETAFALIKVGKL